ncbi:MAG: RNA methyltransferase [Planctomycetota bacterium]
MKRVVLVRTSGPRNAGSVVRAAANFGPAEIVLVAPARPSLLVHPEFEQMAHGVEGGASKLRVVDTLEEALADATHAVGFTARVRNHRVVLPFANERDRIAELADDPEHRLALVFGNESSGLAAEESDLCHELCFLATGSEHGSLNLSMAVTVVLYDLFRPRALHPRGSKGTPLRGDARRYLTENVRRTLGRAALSGPAKRDIEASVERVFARAPLETRDARAWHQIMRALGSDLVPSDLGLPPQAPRGGPKAPSEEE